MPIDDTIPTISEIKGNTILQLLTNAYNTLKNVIFKKQNKLIAGDNIVINDETNRISAIVGGTPVLEDYYTKSEVNALARDLGEEIDTKADSEDTYTKTEVNDLISTLGSFKVLVVDELPTYGERGIIYLLQIAQSGSNKYEEYIWVNQWELLGELSNIDLDNYYTKDESNNRYYTKTECNERYYNKSEIDVKVKEKFAIINNSSVAAGNITSTPLNIPLSFENNTDELFTLIDNELTVLESGYYLINSNVQVGEQGTQYFVNLELSINNTIKTIAADDNCLWDHTLQISILTYLSANDKITFKISGSNTTSLIVRGKNSSISFIKIR